jgi:hypothetical protein
MFPGNRFPTPYFIHYGKDGAAPRVDQADEYVYAISNNGFWNNGDRYFLARVKQSKLPRLDGADWQFFRGGDGAREENWSRQPQDAVTLIDNPTRCGMTGATYIPAFRRYLLIAWYYPRDMNTESDETRFIYYEAPHPWGPWTAIKEQINRPAGWYSPRVLAKWQRPRGDEVQAVIATAGDFWEIPWFYKFTVLPLELKANGQFPAPPPHPPALVVNCRQIGTGLAEINYGGAWKYIERDKDLDLGEFCSTQAGDSFTITFVGTRIRWYSCKGNKVGIAKVSLDGGPEVTLDLWTRWAPETLYNRLAYDSGHLPAGRHSITVKVTGEKNPQSLGTSVFNEKLEIDK